MSETNEQAWVIWGSRYQHWAWGWLEPLATGAPTSVSFEGQPLLTRFEQKRDLLGFAHTHPNFSVTPSETDHQTMQAWSLVLGRPVLSLIMNQHENSALWYNYLTEFRQPATALCFGNFCLLHF